jgi:hypothetical protein
MTWRYGVSCKSFIEAMPKSVEASGFASSPVHGCGPAGHSGEHAVKSPGAFSRYGEIRGVLVYYRPGPVGLGSWALPKNRARVGRLRQGDWGKRGEGKRLAIAF